MSARTDAPAPAVLDCGCRVELTRAQVAARRHGRRVVIGCQTHRRDSRVTRVEPPPEPEEGP